MENLSNSTIEPSFEPTAIPTNSTSKPTLEQTLTPRISNDGSRFVIMVIIIFIVFCVLYTYFRSKITSRVAVEESRENRSRFSSVIIF